MYKLVRVRKRAKTRRSGENPILQHAIYLDASWAGKQVVLLDKKCFNKMIVDHNKLKRKIKKAVNLLFKG